jgi:GT2 family glycosyltransferase
MTQEGVVEDAEVIIADGMSEDRTRRIVSEIAKEASNLRLVDNPSGTTPSAMNRGIKASRGKYVAILGAHTQYAPDYLRTCVELLDTHPDASCVGGPIVSKGRSLFGQAVATAMSHPVGIGNARHRHPNYEGYAEGACFPMFRKEVFEKVGLYDEALLRNQDDELNYRLAKYGEKVFISPRARCTYFVRETPIQLFKQYFHYGFWRVAVLRKHRMPASLRQLAPPVFMCLMLVLAIVGMALPGWWKASAIALPVIYGTTLIGAGTGEVKRSGWGVAFLFPIAAGIMHSAYAAGFATAIFRKSHRTVQELNINRGEHHAARY